MTSIFHWISKKIMKFIFVFIMNIRFLKKKIENFINSVLISFQYLIKSITLFINSIYHLLWKFDR